MNCNTDTNIFWKTFEATLKTFSSISRDVARADGLKINPKSTGNHMIGGEFKTILNKGMLLIWFFVENQRLVF